MRVLVTEKISESGVELLKREFDVDVALGLSPQELLEKIGGYDGLIVRSATKVTAEVIEVFREAADLFEELHNPYRRLIGSDGKLNSSNETAVWRADEALHRVFRQKLLE